MPNTKGVELMKQLNDGSLQKVAPKEVRRVRRLISDEIEELLEFGARVRPLFSGEKVIGWVRGVHPSERKQLRRYLYDPIKTAECLIRIGTSLSDDYLRTLSSLEMRALVRVIKEMSDSDLRLYPFISAFVTTSTSEQLWHGRGIELSAYQRRSVVLPDGVTMTLLAAPDQARLWATLCSYREKSKQRLDASMNSLMILRPWAGKGADGLANELKAVSRALMPDVIDPWTDLVKIKPQINLDDGWAHGEDDSREGILRELEGMMSNDRHERVIAKMEQDIKDKAAKQQKKIEEAVEKRGGPGFIDVKREILTTEQVRARVEQLRADRAKGTRQEESESSGAARLGRYE